MKVRFAPELVRELRSMNNQLDPREMAIRPSTENVEKFEHVLEQNTFGAINLINIDPVDVENITEYVEFPYLNDCGSALRSIDKMINLSNNQQSNLSLSQKQRLDYVIKIEALREQLDLKREKLEELQELIIYMKLNRSSLCSSEGNQAIKCIVKREGDGLLFDQKLGSDHVLIENIRYEVDNSMDFSRVLRYNGCAVTGDIIDVMFIQE